ncbi:hypothetical protein ACFL1A_02325 [Patescibacteria group bacterium]
MIVNSRKIILRSVLISILLLLVVYTSYLAVDDYLFSFSRKTSQVFSPVGQDISEMEALSSDSKTANVIKSPLANPLPTNKSENFSVTFVDLTTEIIEGGVATFSWNVNGPAMTIHDTAIYLGPKSTSGHLTTSVTPDESGYSAFIPDFIDGNFAIPLRFVASIDISQPQKYFARAYAFIDGKHFWSDERSFNVTVMPKHEIKVVQFPDEVYKGANASFTWEVYGPAATTGFTAIVGGKTSSSGALDDSIILQETPYSVLTNDFVSGSYKVPLRFIGNTVFEETGTYYFRALSFINNKNIWSEEYSIIVK